MIKKMEKLPMCRLCSAENVRMYTVVNRNLHKLYEKLTDIPFVTEDRRPLLACFFCSSKLKQCYKFLRNCLIADKLFAQILDADYEPNPLNPDLLVISGGLVKTTIEYISIVDVEQTESIAMKEKLPAVCVCDEIIEPKEAHQNDGATVAKKPKLDRRRTKQDAIPTEPKKIEKSNSNIIQKTKKRATVTKNSNLEDAIPAEQMKKEKLNPKVIRARATRKRTSKPDTRFKEPYKCDQFNLNGVKQSIQHTLTRIDQKHQCDVCQRRFSVMGLLINHIRIHTGEKPFKCEICQRSFTEKGNLTKHNLLHTGEKRYKCNVCSRRFRGKYTLRKHIRIHTGEKPYKCDLCQRTFRERGNITKHIRIHTGEKPYTCDVCQHSFSEKGNLTKHKILMHSGKYPYKCEICLKSFSDSSAVEVHLRVHM